MSELASEWVLRLAPLFAYSTVTSYEHVEKSCLHCRAQPHDHVDGRKCLFSPTTYEPYGKARMLDAHNAYLDSMHSHTFYSSNA